MITRVKATNYRCFRDLDFSPDPELNIIVGDNEAGKSTLLEVISLVITGKVRGRWANDELSPYWFNQEAVEDFFGALRNDLTPDIPSLDLEVFFSEDTPGAERLRGLHNSERLDVPGLRMRVIPDPDQQEELSKYFNQQDIPAVIPTDLLQVSWTSFNGPAVTRQPRGLGIASINASQLSRGSGVDFKLRQLLREFVKPEEGVKIALAHRRAKAELTDGVLSEVNERIRSSGDSLGVGLQMDQSTSSNWDVAVTPQIENIPFSYLGQGKQVSTKVTLALSQTAENTHFILVEEPENHLSHTKLTSLIDVISRNSGGRQLFITTHSSYVLNRLGFDKLHLMHNARIAHLIGESISEDTTKYFQKQSGYDTLRLVIASKVVVVEGPSDEMIFNRAYQNLKGKEPRDNGIDVIALGTRGKRALELAKALGKKIAVVRDNDGKSPSYWREQAGDLLEDGLREMFVGAEDMGNTLEPQVVSVNDPAVLRSILGISEDKDLKNSMISEKTESAWRLVNATESLHWPSYIIEAIEFIDAN